MRTSYLVLAALALAGCAADDTLRPPTLPVAPAAAAPASPAPVAPKAGGGQSGIVWVMVIDGTGVCIDDATVQVVGGQSVGPSVVQDANCDAWSYDGGVLFQNLTPGVEMTIRATTPSGRVQEKTVMPAVGVYSVTLFSP